VSRAAVALGGNALLQKGNPDTADAMRRSARIAAEVIGVYEEFGTPEQRRLSTLAPDEARRRLDAGEFGAGSMRPKVEAAVQFAEGGGTFAVICALADGGRALAGRAGTRITH
jgi:carbamate kinase